MLVVRMVPQRVCPGSLPLLRCCGCHLLSSFQIELPPGGYGSGTLDQATIFFLIAGPAIPRDELPCGI
jgi:hypothetical protein